MKKKTLLKTTLLLGTAYIGLSILAKKKKADSVYDTEPEQKNPMEGKKVVFVENEEEPENADGMKGHLEVVGDSEPRISFYDTYVKRSLDLAASFAGLVVLSPVLAGIALAIKIDDPGPVLFTQKRVGKNKQYFKLHKFRTMKMCTPHDVPTHMLQNPEQYITRVGKFLRKSSLDELPQLWDIFLGNISTIGPRPALWSQDYLVAERDKYGANDIRPGLTGWAQINGRDELEIPVKAKLDGEYTAKESALFDAKCFLGTVKSVAGSEGVVEGGTGSMEDEGLPMPIPAVLHEDIDWSSCKKVLIAGEGSYIGESVKEYLNQFDQYQVETLDTMSEAWKEAVFSGYDAIIDVAGIAHVKETDANRDLYYQVNTELAVELAKKAKEENVEQFIYLSSMSVYGMTTGSIDGTTPCKPKGAYGGSKLQAEKKLWELCDENFTVSLVRPPMVFGKGCKGNYQSLRKLALKIPVFPRVENERSMIHIENLASALRGILHNNESGVYFPQNLEYVDTYDMVEQIAACNGKEMYPTSLLTLPIAVAKPFVSLVQKVFGSLTYDQDLNVPESWIVIPDTATCIIKTEITEEVEA